MLLVVPQIDKLPHAVIASEEADLKLFSLICWTRCFGGTVLKNDLSLRQILDDRRVLAEQDQSCIRHAVIRDCAAVVEKLLLRQRGKLLFAALFDPLGTEVFNGCLVQIIDRCPGADRPREVAAGFFIDAAAHILRHGLERIALVNPRYAVVLYRHADGTALYVEDQNPLSLVVEKLKINIDLQFLNQAHAGTLRLVESCAPDHAAGSLVRDAKYQLTAAIVRQSTAALRRLSKVKPIFGFLELDVFALFGFQKLLDSF